MHIRTHGFMQSKQRWNDLLQVMLYIIFFAGLFFNWRAISSICIGLLLFAGIFNTVVERSPVAKDKAVIFFLAACAVFFLLQFSFIFLEKTGPLFWQNIGLKSGILFTPLAVMLTRKVITLYKKELLRAYCLFSSVAMLWCLLNAFIYFQKTNDPSVFFYHQFISPFSNHAVYYSLYVFFALVFLLETARKQDYLFHRFVQTVFIILLSFSLLLLSSKLVITFYFIYLLFLIIKTAGVKKQGKVLLGGFAILFLLLATIVLTGQNKAAERFRDLFSGDALLHRQESFHPGIYFNGLQFRLLQLKLVPAILDEQNRWWTGAGPDRAQQWLNQQYVSRNMYTGNGRSDKGYTGYNTHNQFLESLLKNGIPGLLAFTLLCIALLVLAFQKRNYGRLFILASLAAYAFVESVLETQYGIILFTFFPAFLYQDD